MKTALGAPPPRGDDEAEDDRDAEGRRRRTSSSRLSRWITIVTCAGEACVGHIRFVHFSAFLARVSVPRARRRRDIVARRRRENVPTNDGSRVDSCLDARANPRIPGAFSYATFDARRQRHARQRERDATHADVARCGSRDASSRRRARRCGDAAFQRNSSSPRTRRARAHERDAHGRRMCTNARRTLSSRSLARGDARRATGCRQRLLNRYKHSSDAPRPRRSAIARARGAPVKSDYIARIARERRPHRDAVMDVHTEHRAFAKRHDTVPSNHVFCAMEGKRARRRRRARAMACVHIPLSVSTARWRRSVRRRVRVANARNVLRSRLETRALAPPRKKPPFHSALEASPTNTQSPRATTALTFRVFFHVPHARIL